MIGKALYVKVSSLPQDEPARFGLLPFFLDRGNDRPTGQPRGYLLADVYLGCILHQLAAESNTRA